jgi:hypothetical protein
MSLLLSAALYIALLGSADASQSVGKSFDCYFQTSPGKLDRVSMWLGEMKKGWGQTPQFDDSSHIFVRTPASEKPRVAFHIDDKWPEQISVNYFEPKVSNRALSLLTIWNRKSTDVGNLTANILQLDPSATADAEGNIPSERAYKGLCNDLREVTYAEFAKASTQ